MTDPEITAMSAMVDALADLEDDARGRVLRWVAERFGVTSRSVAPELSTRLRSEGSVGADGVTEEQISAEALTFEHFADLFNAAGPQSNEDKALVAGYWFQALRGEEKFKAADLQGELKNLGHAIPNITDALTSNIRRKPARILQLAKAGAAQQARKTYKLTHEGLVHVQGMIGHGA